MTRSKKFLILTLALSVVATLPASGSDTATVGRATRHDVSPPLSEMALPVPVKTGFNVEVNPIVRLRTRLARTTPARSPGPRRRRLRS